ncbi:MAG: hypothetical protein EXR84_05775 [Gammaproteobacteria bacterium]|nr:hypothetical protein [Gammaproteobacteria bacterium]
MRLPDFTTFAPFNLLRQQMGTTQLGYFELFDPVLHLTGKERSELERSGVLQALEDIKVLPDRMLAVKNSRVIAYNANENWYCQQREYPTYHVAFCSQLEELRSAQAGTELLLTSKVAEDYNLVKIRTSGEVSLRAHGFVVCKHCLHTLRYKDFDEFRNRRRGYSQKVLSEFNLKEFFHLYQQYPLSFGRRPLPAEAEPTV